jgi:5-methylcytosine-specific restriction endonuclease McrA
VTWTNGGAGSHIPERSKRAVRRRQHNSCAIIDASICLGTIDEYDHVVNLASLDIERRHANDPALLQGLCKPCHAKKTSAEGHAAKRAKRFRKPLEHPGLVEKKTDEKDRGCDS